MWSSERCHSARLLRILHPLVLSCTWGFRVGSDCKVVTNIGPTELALLFFRADGGKRDIANSGRV